MMVSRLDVRGIGQAIGRLKAVKKAIGSTEYKYYTGLAAMKCLVYWRENVYRWFDTRIDLGYPVSGQLGRSLNFNHTEKSAVFTMGPIYHVYKQSIWEYGQFLRKGVRPTWGMKYSPAFDMKIRTTTGGHPGYSPATKWDPWMREFKNVTRQYYVWAIEQTIKEVTHGNSVG